MGTEPAESGSPPPVPTVLYKYRSASPLERVLDIAMRERLYCALYSTMNDPFEGQFLSALKPAESDAAELAERFGFSRTVAAILTDGRVRGSVEDLSRQPAQGRQDVATPAARICSLSASAEDVRMWSLYASAHTGVAFEVDVSGFEGTLKRVDYQSTLLECNISKLRDLTAEQVLSCKTEHWSYEQEYRVFAPEAFVSVKGRIRRAILGLRASQDLEEFLRRTVGPNVKIVRTRLDHDGLRVVTQEQAIRTRFSTLWGEERPIV